MGIFIAIGLLGIIAATIHGIYKEGWDDGYYAGRRQQKWEDDLGKMVFEEPERKEQDHE